MKRIARFEKVSFGQFSDGWDDTFQAIEKGEIKIKAKKHLRKFTIGSSCLDVQRQEVRDMTFLLRLTLY